MGTVYGLLDPITNELRYVGQTVQPLEQRLKFHMISANGGRKGYVQNWIRSLDERPKIVAIHSDVPDEELDKREIDEIALQKSKGARLTNVASGGGGSRALSEKARRNLIASLRGRQHTPEARQAIADAWLEDDYHYPDCPCPVCSPKSGEDHPRFGTHHTEETKRTIGEKVSKANRGKSKSPEHVARVWAARRENGTDGHTDETRAKISRTKRERASVTVPCPECGRECKGEAGMRIHRKKAHRRV